MHALPFDETPINSCDRIFGLKEFDYSKSVSIGIFMGLITAFKRFYYGRKLVPILASYLATATGCTFANIVKIR